MSDTLTVPPLPPDDGLMPRLVTRLFFRNAQVTDNRPLVPGLHLIRLAGPALRDVQLKPGDKLQVKIGSGLVMRTYTPVRWNPASGQTDLLAHALATGPGSEWVRRAAPGQQVSVFGPRRSLDLNRFDPSRSVLVGDETSIGLAAAWRPYRALFEVGQPGAVQALLGAMGLPATTLARQSGDAPPEPLTLALLSLAAPDSQFVLTGRARTVQHLLRALKQHGVPSRRILTKAYWADGKAGLD